MEEVKWLPLRLNILPLLQKQAQHVLAIFITMLGEINKGDILAISRLTDLKEQVNISRKR
jgi:hypothetical protein